MSSIRKQAYFETLQDLMNAAKYDLSDKTYQAFIMCKDIALLKEINTKITDILFDKETNVNFDELITEMLSHEGKAMFEKLFPTFNIDSYERIQSMKGNRISDEEGNTFAVEENACIRFVTSEKVEYELELYKSGYSWYPQEIFKLVDSKRLYDEEMQPHIDEIYELISDLFL